MKKFRVKRFIWYFRGLAGYALDMYRSVRFNLECPHSYTKFLIINRVRAKTDAKIFVEVGTGCGITASRCAPVFDWVYTIELDRSLAEQASKYLTDKENVTVICGDGLEVLPDLLQNDKVNDILIFLDGHFSGNGTACGVMPEPAVEELKILSRYIEKIRAIIIDDFRCFGMEVDFPAKSALLKSAEDYFADNNFEIAVQFDQLVITRKS